MKTSQAGLDLIQQFEGFSTKPYLCPAGKWTIGYGWTHGVTKDSKPITEAEATKLLIEGLENYEIGVLECVDVDLAQNEFDALVSFSYNLGLHNLRTSTLLKKLNQGDYDRAAEEFLRWDKATIGGKRIQLPGLVKRRIAEMGMFLGGNNEHTY